MVFGHSKVFGLGRSNQMDPDRWQMKDLKRRVTRLEKHLMRLQSDMRRLRRKLKADDIIQPNYTEQERSEFAQHTLEQHSYGPTKEDL